MRDPVHLPAASPTRRPRFRRERDRRRWPSPDPDALRLALQRLADAVLLQAVRDAQAGSASAHAFLTDAHGPDAESRQTWLALSGRRGR